MRQLAVVATADVPALATGAWLPAAVLAGLVVAVLLLRRRRVPVARPGEVWFAMVPYEDGTRAGSACGP